MLETIRDDLRRKTALLGLPPTLGSYVRVCGGEGSLTQILVRATHFCHARGLRLSGLVLYRVTALVGHAVIGRGAEFGPGLVIFHSNGITINSEVRAGKNLTLQHEVTLGHNEGSPVLGDNVFVGAGAKVIGPVRIGNDVRIGANAVVTRDLPDGATAVGVPARVVRIDGKRVPGVATSREQDPA